MSSIRAPRAFTLHAEVLREFDLVAADDQGEWSPAEHALYLAPWRDKLVDGSLGPYYGPTTESRYNEQMRRFDEECRGGIGSGSLWDAEEYERMHSPRAVAKKVTRTAQRADGETLRMFVRVKGDELPRRELEVYSAYWVDGLSVRQTAVRMGVGEQAVGEWIRRLRKRVAKVA